MKVITIELHDGVMAYHPQPGYPAYWKGERLGMVDAISFDAKRGVTKVSIILEDGMEHIVDELKRSEDEVMSVSIEAVDDDEKSGVGV